MNTSKFELIFERPELHPAIGRIMINPISMDKQGNIFITSWCHTFNELSYEIDLIMQDLEKIRKSAKKKFTKQ